MSDTPMTDELAEVSTCMSDEEIVKAYKKLARKLERDNAALTRQRDAAREMLEPWKEAAARCAKAEAALAAVRADLAAHHEIEEQLVRERNELRAIVSIGQQIRDNMRAADDFDGLMEKWDAALAQGGTK